MSKVFNMVGGGGGKNISSIIIAGLKSTDTVTCTKDGKSYTATWHETDQHWEIVGLPLGTFTITATDGADTKTETVLIDITGVYGIYMSFPKDIATDFKSADAWTIGYIVQSMTCTKWYSDTYLMEYDGTKLPDGYLYGVALRGDVNSATFKTAYIETDLIDCSDFSLLTLEFALKYPTSSNYPAVYASISVIDNAGQVLKEERRQGDSGIYYGTLSADISDAEKIKIRLTTYSPGVFWAAMAPKSIVLS